MLCNPKSHFSDRELTHLNTIYDASGISFMELREFRNNPVAGEHCADLMEVLERHPEWELTQGTMDVLNGETWMRHIGRFIWSTFVGSTECRCCLGWRLACALLLSTAVGVAAGQFLKV
jgi:hypothetical protein